MNDPDEFEYRLEELKDEEELDFDQEHRDVDTAERVRDMNQSFEGNY